MVQVLTQHPDYQTARKYWNKLKERLRKEGSESVTNCLRLKLPAADGKNYLTDCATAKAKLLPDDAQNGDQAGFWEGAGSSCWRHFS